MHADAGALSIGEVAERTGLSVHTLRFYERADLTARGEPHSSCRAPMPRSRS